MVTLSPSSSPQVFPLSVERCDPEAMVKDALALPGEGRAEDLFVAWVLRLPVEIDAADAATVLLHAYRDLPRRGGLGRRVSALLHEAQAYPRERLADLPRPRHPTKA
jgi:hypothetical protein